MPIPEEIRVEVETLLDKYCGQLIPAHAQGKVRIGYIAKGMTITLFESHPNWKDKTKWMPFDVARFRYNKNNKQWKLYWRDRNHKWHDYDLVEATTEFEQLLKEVDKDPTGIFWG